MSDTENSSRPPEDQDRKRSVDRLVASAYQRNAALGIAVAFLAYWAEPFLWDVAVKVGSDFSAAKIKSFFEQAEAEEKISAKDAETKKVLDEENNPKQNDHVVPQPSVPKPIKALGWVAVVTSARAQDKIIGMQDVVDSVASACSSKLGRSIEIRIAQAPNYWWAALAVEPDGATSDDAKEIAKCFDGFPEIQGPCFTKSADFYGLQ